MRRILVFVLLLSSSLIFVGLWGVFKSHEFNGQVLREPQKAAEIVMRSADGPVRFSDHRGKFVLLYFGYTSCPDVCPTALANLKLALAELSPEEANQVDVIFISVDSDRDTPEKLKKYAAMFDERFIGATGTREEIDLVTSAFGVSYKINSSGPDDQNYSVDHSAFVTVIDRDGFAVLRWEHGTVSSEMSADLKFILKNGVPVDVQILAGPTYTPVVCAVTIVPAHAQGGEWLYQHHCAQCHGADLSGNPAWETEFTDGTHLAPPLNQEGKAWQYSEQDLVAIIKNGRNLDKPVHMPAFKNTLANWEINFILTYIKSQWDINQLNYQHGFMTLTPQASPTPFVIPSLISAATPTP